MTAAWPSSCASAFTSAAGDLRDLAVVFVEQFDADRAGFALPHVDLKAARGAEVGLVDLRTAERSGVEVFRAPGRAGGLNGGHLDGGGVGQLQHGRVLRSRCSR